MVKATAAAFWISRPRMTNTVPSPSNTMPKTSGVRGPHRSVSRPDNAVLTDKASIYPVSLGICGHYRVSTVKWVPRPCAAGFDGRIYLAQGENSLREKTRQSRTLSRTVPALIIAPSSTAAVGGAMNAPRTVSSLASTVW
jgi:hypothetical protein